MNYDATFNKKKETKRNSRGIWNFEIEMMNFKKKQFR